MLFLQMVLDLADAQKFQKMLKDQIDENYNELVIAECIKMLNLKNRI